VPHGLLDATDDPAMIEQWWAREPDANIGIATGEASGFFVVDIDRKNGGLESWLTLTANREEPETAIVSTSSGGVHFYFKLPPNGEIRNSASTVAPGIDVRGSGGYVVAAGSTRPDGVYRWRSAPR